MRGRERGDAKICCLAGCGSIRSSFQDIRQVALQSDGVIAFGVLSVFGCGCRGGRVPHAVTASWVKSMKIFHN